jgi:hypothetical protein
MSVGDASPLKASISLPVFTNVHSFSTGLPKQPALFMFYQIPSHNRCGGI